MADGQRPVVEATPRTEVRGVAARLLTVDDVVALSAAGAFGEGEKVELIDGRLYLSPSEGVRHLDHSGRVGDALFKLLSTTGLDRDWRLIPNLSLRISPVRLLQPDWAVVKRGVLEVERRFPGPADVALAVEIADSSLLFDEGDKKELYAEARLSDYWVVRIGPGDVRICREPEGGLYKFDRVARPGEGVAPLFALGREIAITDLTGPAG